MPTLIFKRLDWKQLISTLNCYFTFWNRFSLLNPFHHFRVRALTRANVNFFVDCVYRVVIISTATSLRFLLSNQAILVWVWSVLFVNSNEPFTKNTFFVHIVNTVADEATDLTLANVRIFVTRFHLLPEFLVPMLMLLVFNAVFFWLVHGSFCAVIY